MSEHMAEPDTRERNPKVQMAWGLLAPYIASEDPPDLSDDDQAEILTAGALPQVWSIMLELEARLSKMEEALEKVRDSTTHMGGKVPQHFHFVNKTAREALAGESDD